MDKKTIEQEKLYLENTIKEIDSIREIESISLIVFSR